MQNYKEEEEEIERLVNRLVEGVAEDVMVDNDQGEDSLHELMDVDMGQTATHSPLLVDMCHYSDVYLQQILPPIQVRITMSK